MLHRSRWGRRRGFLRDSVTGETKKRRRGDKSLDHGAIPLSWKARGGLPGQSARRRLNFP